MDDGVYPEGVVRESMQEEKVATPEELLEKWEYSEVNKPR